MQNMPKFIFFPTMLEYFAEENWSLEFLCFFLSQNSKFFVHWTSDMFQLPTRVGNWKLKPKNGQFFFSLSENVQILMNFATFSRPMRVECGSFSAVVGRQKWFKAGFELVEGVWSTKLRWIWVKIVFMIPTSGICNVGKKPKLGIFWILLPIFCQLHEDILKLFIVRIFN